MHNKYLWKEEGEEGRKEQKKDKELPMNWDLIVESISYSTHMILMDHVILCE